MKKIFLEGPIQTGKSTLIREILAEHLTECGGFTSQRLVDDTGKTRGFRIGPAAVTPLTAPLGGMRPGPAPAWDPNRGIQLPEYLLTAPDGNVYSGVFKYFDRMGRVHKDQEVFDVLGAYYLTSSRGAPLILLDEIGGSELLSEPFCDALYDLLASDVPCIGVLKLAESARHMQRAYGYGDPDSGNIAGMPGMPAASDTPDASAKAGAAGSSVLSIVDRNLQLRQRILEDFSGEILYYERSEGAPGAAEAAVRAALTDFVRRIW